MKDVLYRTIGDTQLYATLYTPHRSGIGPAIVEVHGGAWVYGDRHKNRRLCEYLAASGAMVMALDFRAPPDCYPASVADVNAGIVWLKQHVASLGWNPALVGGLGSSSGGHLVLLNGLQPNNPSYCDKKNGDGDYDASLAMLVTCWPIVDPFERYIMATNLKLKNLITAHDDYWIPATNMEHGNPQRIVDTRTYTDLPPILIVQGTNDANMTQEMIDRFATSYRAAGGELALDKYDEQPHDFFAVNPEIPATALAMKRISDFIVQHGMDDT